MRKNLSNLLLCMLLLSACSTPPPEPQEALFSTPENGEAMCATMLEDEARPLSEEEILTAYHRAVEIYSWFERSPLPSSGESLRADGFRYHRVDADGLENLEDLRTYLRSVFSSELTERLLEGSGRRVRYRDIDGQLYVTGTGRNRKPGKGQAHIELDQLDSGVYSVNVLVNLLDSGGETVIGLESWSFPYVFVEDRWVFTDFQLID